MTRSLSRTWAILKRDLEDAVRNSTFVLVLLGPVFCSILFFRVSAADDFARPKLGIVGSKSEGLGLVLSTSDSLKALALPSVDSAQDALEDGDVDGFIVLSEEINSEILSDGFPTLELQTADPVAVKTVLLTSAIEEASRTVAGQEIPVDILVSGSISDGEKDWSRGLLPSWLVFTSMSALMVVSAAVIEEKEQRTLVGVLTAPVSMLELWVGKVGSGFLLAYLSTLTVLLGNGVSPSPILLLHLSAGCFCFAALGMLVGLLCSNQSAANAATSTLFMVIYIPLALQELSEVLSRAAAFTPAFYLQRGTRAMLAGQTQNGVLDLAVLSSFLIVFAVWGLVSARSSKRILSDT